MNPPLRALVLDSQGLSGWLEDSRQVRALLHAAWEDGADVFVSAVTILEVSHRRLDRDRLDWVLSRITVEPVTRASARKSAALLAEAGMHGHSHALDACVAELAMRYLPTVAVLTSDPRDLRRLCQDRVRIISI